MMNNRVLFTFSSSANYNGHAGTAHTYFCISNYYKTYEMYLSWKSESLLYRMQNALTPNRKLPCTKQPFNAQNNERDNKENGNISVLIFMFPFFWVADCNKALLPHKINPAAILSPNLFAFIYLVVSNPSQPRTRSRWKARLKKIPIEAKLIRIFSPNSKVFHKGNGFNLFSFWKIIRVVEQIC